MDNELPAYREFLDQRISELRTELAAEEEALGIRASESTVPVIMAYVSEALRAQGKSELASEFQSAYDTLDGATRTLERLHAAGVAMDEARMAMDEALEAFQRVEARVQSALGNGDSKPD